MSAEEEGYTHGPIFFIVSLLARTIARRRRRRRNRWLPSEMQEGGRDRRGDVEEMGVGRYRTVRRSIEGFGK